VPTTASGIDHWAIFATCGSDVACGVKESEFLRTGLSTRTIHHGELPHNREYRYIFHRWAAGRESYCSGARLSVNHVGRFIHTKPSHLEVDRSSSDFADVFTRLGSQIWESSGHLMSMIIMGFNFAVPSSKTSSNIGSGTEFSTWMLEKMPRAMSSAPPENIFVSSRVRKRSQKNTQRANDTCKREYAGPDSSICPRSVDTSIISAIATDTAVAALLLTVPFSCQSPATEVFNGDMSKYRQLVLRKEVLAAHTSYLPSVNGEKSIRVTRDSRAYRDTTWVSSVARYGRTQYASSKSHCPNRRDKTHR